MAINLIQLKYNYEDYEAIFIYKTAHSQTQISSQKMSTSNATFLFQTRINAQKIQTMT